MNIIALDQKTLLHDHFLKFTAGNREITIDGKALTKHKENINRIKEVETYVKNKPEQNNNLIEIEGLGKFEGNIEKEANEYFIDI